MKVQLESNGAEAASLKSELQTLADDKETLAEKLAATKTKAFEVISVLETNVEVMTTEKEASGQELEAMREKLIVVSGEQTQLTEANKALEVQLITCRMKGRSVSTLVCISISKKSF